jgi:hypothetical protein
LHTEQENNIKKVNTELNNAYCLKSYVDLSDKLNKEYPLFDTCKINGNWRPGRHCLLLLGNRTFFWEK